MKCKRVPVPGYSTETMVCDPAPHRSHLVVVQPALGRGRCIHPHTQTTALHMLPDDLPYKTLTQSEQKEIVITYIRL